MATLESGLTGSVKWFNGQKGFGFIVRDDNGQDVFAHASMITAKNPSHQYGSLAEGEQVQFDIAEGKRGPQAINITGPGGANVQGNDQQGYGGGGGGYGGGGGRGGFGGGGYGGRGGGGYGGGGRGGYGGGGGGYGGGGYGGGGYGGGQQWGGY